MAKSKTAHADPQTQVIPAKSGASLKKIRTDRPIASVYPAIDNDLARDNLENDLTEADLQDL